jgi:hypothetical protein
MIAARHQVRSSLVPVFLYPFKTRTISRQEAAKGFLRYLRSNTEAPLTLKRSTPLSRPGSIRQALKPLVDLTPRFEEQSQHLRKERGVTPIPGKPLIELTIGVEGLPGAIITPAARA